VGEQKRAYQLEAIELRLMPFRRVPRRSLARANLLLEVFIPLALAALAAASAAIVIVIRVVDAVGAPHVTLLSGEVVVDVNTASGARPRALRLSSLVQNLSRAPCVVATTMRAALWWPRLVIGHLRTTRQRSRCVPQSVDKECRRRARKKSGCGVGQGGRMWAGRGVVRMRVRGRGWEPGARGAWCACRLVLAVPLRAQLARASSTS